MYLSRIELNTALRTTMRAMASPNLFHGALEASFQGEREHALWRRDRLNGKEYLLVLSSRQPDFSSVAAQFGYGAESWECLPYEKLLNRIAAGSRWHFRLTANPTYSVPGDGERGKVHAHKTPEHQLQWLLRQAEKNGFSTDAESVRILQSRPVSFYREKGAPQVRLFAVTFEGSLTVTDPVRFREALCGGIGRGKAYGMGLLTVVRADG